MDFIHLVIINVNWYHLVLLAIGIIVLITNIMLTVTSLDKNKDDTAKVKIKIVAQYVAISFILYGGLVLMLVAELKIKLLRDFIEFINSVINSSLNKLPLGWILLWIGIPLVSCYIVFTIKGIIYYQKRRSSYSSHTKSSSVGDSFDFSKLITFDNVQTTKDLRKFIRSATEKPQYGNFCNANWIAIYSDNQKIDNRIKLPSNLSYPSLLINRNKKWEEITINDALKIIRLSKSKNK